MTLDDLSESKLIEDYKHIVLEEVRKTVRNKLELEDYIQIGFLGLIKAVRKFDPSQGGFENYAKACIKNELMASFKKRSKKSFYYKYDEKKSEKVWEVLPDSLTSTEKVVLRMKCENYTNKEIADFLNLTKKYVKKVYIDCINKIKHANQ
jgi:DNA-directed RNA polymerase specialized sigma subunit